MDAFLPGGQLERPLSWLGRARLPAHLRVLTATTPAAVLSPPRATRIRSRTACNRRAAPLPSIVGAGIEDPCAICPEICGVTRLEPYVATRRGGGRLAEGSSSHISWCVHCAVWFLYLHRCRSRGPAVQGATGSGRTWQRRLFTNSPLEPPTRYPPHPQNARNLHPRLSLAHRLRFTLSPAQRTRSGWLQPPTSSTRARAEELLRTHRAASAFACCTYSASRSHAS